MIEKRAGNTSRFGFTVVELLVVVGIVGLLIGMTIPAVQSVRAAARRTSCANNLRQIAIGLSSYESARQSFPAGISWNQDQGRFRQSSWLFHVCAQNHRLEWLQLPL